VQIYDPYVEFTIARYGDNQKNDLIKDEWQSGQLSMSKMRKSNRPPPPAGMKKRTRLPQYTTVLPLFTIFGEN